MYVKRPLCVLCLIFGIIIFIFAGAAPPQPSFDVDAYDGMKLTATGQITDKSIKNENINVTLSDCRIYFNSDGISSPGLMASFPLDKYSYEQFKIGQTIKFSGNFRAADLPENEGEFNLRQYYALRGIDGSVKKASLTAAGKKFSVLKENLALMRQAFADMLEESMPEEEYGVLCALILGSKNDLDSELKENYQRAGIAHILSLSGLHIATLGLFVLKLLKRTGLPECISVLISLSLLICYSLMTGMSTSTVRALIMFILCALSSLVNRAYDLISSACLACILILLANPYYIIDVGFELSFGAVLGIALINPALSDMISTIARRFFIQHTVYYSASLDPRQKIRVLFIRILKGIINSFTLSASISLATLPIIASSFYRSSRYGFLLNLIVVPLMSVVLSGGILGLAFGYVSGVLAATEFCYFAKFPDFMRICSFKIVCVILRFYNFLASLASEMPYNTRVLPSPGAIRIILYYGLLSAGIILIGQGRKAKGHISCVDRASHRFTFNNARSIGEIHDNITCSIKKQSAASHITGKSGIYRRLRILSSMLSRLIFSNAHIVSAFLIVLSIVILTNKPRPEFQICNFSVGQGDSSLIFAKNSPVILIDGGSSSEAELAKYTLIPALLSKGIDCLDYVFITHLDSDHVSGILDLLYDKGCGINIRRIVISEYSVCKSRTNESDDNYEALLSICAERNIPILAISRGDSLSFEDFNLSCIWPAKYENTQSPIDINEASLVLKISANHSPFSALFTGDIGTTAEELILSSSNDIDVKDNSTGNNNGTGNNIIANQDAYGLSCTYLKTAHHGSKGSSSSDFLRAVSPDMAVISVGKNNSYGHPHAETLKRLEDSAKRILRTDTNGEIMINVKQRSYSVIEYLPSKGAER